MIKKWISWFNIGVSCFIALLLMGALLLHWQRQELLEQPVEHERKTVLPRNIFEQAAENYSKLNEELLKLQYKAPALQLPNLKNIFLYFGSNNRPDAPKDDPTVHFSIQGTNEQASIPPGKPLYLTVENLPAGPKYHFSPNNNPTPLWIQASPYAGQTTVEVFMRDPSGTILRKPEAHAHFALPEKEYSRFGGGWEISKQRVDGTLLARQKARWYGQDRFLELHGGPEYAFAAGKERIDFGEGEGSYSIFLGTDSCAIWKDDRWQMATPSQDTRSFPMLCVKKIDQRLLNMELWDVNGRGKVILNLLKSIDTPAPKALLRSLKFLGARTLSQYLFEINGERVTLKPQEWLLYRDNKWQLLRDPKEIQAYVDRKINAPLFIFGGVVRKDDKQVLLGTLFNATRTDALSVEVPLSQSTTTPLQSIQSQSATKDSDANKREAERRSAEKKARTVLEALDSDASQDDESEDDDE